MPYTIHNTANNCERALPYTIVSAHCRTQCCAQCRWTFWIAAQEIELFWHTLPHTIHNASHNCERTLPHTILNCRAGNRIILTLQQLFHKFSLSFVTPRAVNIYLQHVCSSYSHHTGALCIRQVLVVPIFLHLPELCIMGSFLFAHVSPA